jgi:hypothetical protein
MRDDMDIGLCNGGLFTDSSEIPAAQVTSVQRAVGITWTMPTTMRPGSSWRWRQFTIYGHYNDN